MSPGLRVHLAILGTAGRLPGHLYLPTKIGTFAEIHCGIHRMLNKPPEYLNNNACQSGPEAGSPRRASSAALSSLRKHGAALHPSVHRSQSRQCRTETAAMPPEQKASTEACDDEPWGWGWGGGGKSSICGGTKGTKWVAKVAVQMCNAAVSKEDVACCTHASWCLRQGVCLAPPS